MDKQQLLKRLEAAWTALKDSYTGLSDAQLLEPGVMGDWSVKDNLAHVTIWEEEALKYLPLISRGEKPPRYARYGGNVLSPGRGCHPFLVQAVCSMLIDNLNTTQREQASIQDVEQAITQVLDEWWNTYFVDLWRRTDEEQRAFLSALKTLERADLSAIAQQTGLDERTARRAMRLLVRRDLVAPSNTDETYSIAAPIFRDWVERGLDL